MKKALFIILALAIIPGLANLIPPSPVLAWNPTSYYKPTTVNGNYSEWDLTDDFFANMYRAGNINKTLESKAYLRYDCVPNTLYVLVLTEPGVNALASGWESAAWAAIDKVSNKVYTGASGNNGTPPDFAWVGLSADNLTAQGYEASFQLDPGNWSIMIHIEVFDSSASQTSATAGFPKIFLPLEVVCLGIHPLAIHINKYISLDNQNNWTEATIPPGPTVVEGTQLYFKFVITNSVNITLNNITLNDTVYNFSGIDPPLPASLTPEGQPGSNFTAILGPFAATTVGLHNNTATTSGYNATGSPQQDSESQDLYYTVIPKVENQEVGNITVQKYVSADDLTYVTGSPWPNVTLGEPVWFKFVVTNSGNKTLSNITLVDSLYNVTGIEPALPSTLNISESYYGVIGPIYEDVGTYNNTATAMGDDGVTTYNNTDNASFSVDQAATVIATLLNPPGPILLGETVQDTININTTTGGIFPDASGNWQLKASQDINFASGVVAVQNGTVSGQLPFNVTSNAWAPPASGTWYFRATYQGDGNYTGSNSTPADEQLTVKECTLNVTSDGCCPITVEWDSESANISAGANQTFTNITCGTNVTLTANTSACCEFVNWTGDVPGGINSTNPITISMDGAKNVTAHCVVEACVATAPDFSICNGTVLSEQLFKDNGANCTAGCNMTVDYSLVNNSTVGTYSYNVICGSGDCEDVATGNVTVNAKPACHITCSVANCTVCYGNSITLTEDGGEADSWLWSPSGATTKQITVVVTGNITYTVTVTNNTTGCNSTCQIQVIDPFPPCNITCDPGSFTICKGDCVNLTACGGGNYTYLWSPGGNTAQTVTICPSTTTVYTVNITNNDIGCWHNYTATVTVIDCEVPVGGIIMPVGKVGLLMPWIALVAAIILAAVILYRRVVRMNWK